MKIHPGYHKGEPTHCNAPPEQWRVVDRNCNYSAFNGYHCTPSNYSALVCLTCGGRWRSAGDYVANLKDATQEERLR